jgi:mannose-P-dolichol utilization defect 1
MCCSIFISYAVVCFKVLLSKGLGIGIIAGSILVKVPQILKIVANKSAAGLNFYSVLLDLFAITCHMSYSCVRGFPFSAWGDSSFLAIQTVTIAILILYYGGAAAKATMFGIAYSLIVYVLVGGMTPIDYLTIAQGFNVPVLLLGKVSRNVLSVKSFYSFLFVSFFLDDSSLHKLH